MAAATFGLFCLLFFCSYSAQAEVCLDVLDIVMMVDTSLSIKKSNFVIMQKFMTTLVDANKAEVGKKHRWAIVPFSDVKNIKAHLNFTDGQTEKVVKDAIKSIKKNGRKTYTGAAMKYAREQVFTSPGARKAAQKVVIILTDGDPSDSVVAEKKLYNENEIYILPIGVDPIKNETLTSLATKPVKIFHVKDFNSLPNLSTSVINSLCADTKCPAPGPKDVVIIADKSLSIRNFSAVTQFMAGLVNYTINDPYVKYAVVTYNDNPSEDIKFNDYKDSKELIAKILALKKGKGRKTYTGKAATMARTEAFSEAHGQRPGSKKTIVLFTDGVASDGPIADKEFTEECPKAGINVITVGVGPDVTDEYLKKWASSEKDNFIVQSLKQLPGLASRVVKSVCSLKKPSIG